MGEKLWSLLRLKADNKNSLKEKYREVYIKEYVEKKIYDWLGNQIIFHRYTFNHAFSKSSNYRYSYGNHDIDFCPNRARRILWIKKVLEATNGTIERLHEIKKDNRGRNIKRRVLFVIEEKYVVVTQETNKEKILEFVTAFIADNNWIKSEKSKKALIEVKKCSQIPQSCGD